MCDGARTANASVYRLFAGWPNASVQVDTTSAILMKEMRKWEYGMGGKEQKSLINAEYEMRILLMKNFNIFLEGTMMGSGLQSSNLRGTKGI